jgi:peroxiredoxin
MKRLFTLLMAFAFFTGVAHAQFLPPVPGIEKDEKGVPKKLDYSIPLTGISDPGILLSHFSQRPLFVFYFSPKCPHCQATFPKYQAILKEYEPRGLQGIAISVGAVKKNDIRMFMDQQNAQIPVFQDENRKFSDLYGTGHVPLMIVVLANGQFIRYTENSAETLDQIKAELNKEFNSAKPKGKK